MKKKIITVILAIAMVVPAFTLIAACDQGTDETPPEIKSIAITNVPTEYLNVGNGTYNLTVTTDPVDTDLSRYSVVWSSSDEKVATVSNKGRITPIDFGTAEITVSISGTDVTDKCMVTVVNPLKMQLGETTVNLIGGAQQENGTVKIEIPAAANDWGNSANFAPEKSDFEVTAKLKFKGDKNHLQAGIMLHENGYSAIKLVRAYTNDENLVQFTGCSGAAGELVGKKDIDDEVESDIIYLRIIKQENNVSAFYSVDGEDFEYISHGTTNITVNYVCLFGASWTTETGTVFFEDLSIKYDNIDLNIPSFNQNTISFKVEDLTGEAVTDCTIVAMQGAETLDVDKTNSDMGAYVVKFHVGMNDVSVSIYTENSSVYEYTLKISDQTNEAFAESVTLKGRASLSDLTCMFESPAAGTVESNKLTITAAADRSSGQDLTKAALHKEMSAKNWTISIKVDVVFNNANQFAGIAIASSSDSSVMNIFGYRNDWGGHVGIWQGPDLGSATDGILTSSGGAGAMDGITHIRVSRKDTVINLFTSTDGVTYTLLANGTIKDDYQDEPLDLYICAFTWDTAFTTDIVFSEYDEIV